MPGDLFLAIVGERADGHEFIPQVFAAGAVGALTTRPVDGPHVLVPDIVGALEKLGAYYRRQLSNARRISTPQAPSSKTNHFKEGGSDIVVGITGSAGKTTTKEFVAAALSPLGKILKTQGNRNTEYTAPLMWADLEPDSKAVVVEMAMRGFGQIAHLASFSRPTIGVVTNIGYSHMLQVGDREGIARAKAELLDALPEDGVAVLWAEDEYLGTLLAHCACPALTFGFSGNADCHISSYQALSWTSSRILGVFREEHFDAELPAVGRHIALGAAAALTVAGVVGVPLKAAADALRHAELPPMRMEVRELNGANVLLDTYNASPPSMAAAIDTISELPCDGRRLAVIGEMKELGDYAEEAHRELGRTLAAAGLDEVIFYGELTVLSYQEAKNRGLVVHQAHTLDDVREFLRKAGDGDSVLVKGSRSLELEKAMEVASK